MGIGLREISFGGGGGCGWMVQQGMMYNFQKILFLVDNKLKRRRKSNLPINGA